MADAIAKEDPLGGDDWGYCASLQVALQQTPQGTGAVPQWAVMVSLRSPFLGQPPLCATMLLSGAGGVPAEQLVTTVTAKMVSDLRQAIAQQKTGMVKAPGLGLPGLPAGLKGALKQGPN